MAEETVLLRISGDASGAVRASSAASRSLGGLQRSAQSTTGRMAALSSITQQQQRNLAALASAARAAGVAAAGLAAVGMGAVVKAGLEFNATMESNQLAFGRFLGSAKEAEAFTKRLFEVAKQTPFEFTELTSAARRMLSFGIEASQVEETLMAVGDTIAAMGGGTEQIQRATLALGQMAAKGRVSAEELLQLTEAGIPAYTILRRELNLSSEEVRNIGESGISSQKAIAALTEGMVEDFGGAAKEQSKTFSGMTSTLRDNWAQTTGAMTRGLFRALRDDWLPAFNDTAEKMAAIWKRPDLTPAQQFQRSVTVIDREFGPLLRRLGREIEQADIPERLGRLLSDAIPIMAEAMARGAGTIAVAFARGFAASDELGRLFLLATVVRYIGGWGLIRATFGRIGATAGASMAGGIAAGTAAGAGAGAVGGTLAGRIATGFKSMLLRGAAGALIVGGIEAVFTEGGIIDTIAGRGVADVGGQLGDKLAGNFGTRLRQATDRESIPALRRLVRESDKTADVVGGLSDEAGDSYERMSERARHALGRLEERQERVGFAVRQLRITFAENLGQIRARTEDNMRLIERSFGSHSKQGKELLIDNYRAATAAIRKAMDRNLIETDKGFAAIDRLLAKQLQLWGLDRSTISRHLAIIGKARGKGPVIGGLRSGGQVPGPSTGDRHPILTEGGEFVVNARATRAFLPLLERINEQIPRFQFGGLNPAISSIARWAMQRYGASISSGLRPGDAGSWHSRGAAVDLTSGNMLAMARGIFGAFRPRLEELFYDPLGYYIPTQGQVVRGAIGGHLDHVHAAALGAALATAGIRLPRMRGDFAVGALMAGRYNRHAAGLERLMERAIGATGAGVSPEVSGPWVEVMRGIARSRSWNFGDWMRLVMGESSGRPSVVNPTSGAFGLGQFLPSTYRTYGGGPGSSAAEQISAMAAYIADRYDNPSRAYQFWQAQSPHWYQAGGLVGRFRRSGQRIARLDERIDIAQRLAAFPRSPGGEELAVSEKAQQINLYQRLREKLRDRRRFAARLLRHRREQFEETEERLRRADRSRREPLRATLGRLRDDIRSFRESLIEIQGMTGRGGRLLDVREALAGLRAAPTAESERLAERNELLRQQLREQRQAFTLSQAQFRVFKGFLPPYIGAFAGGGIVPGPLGAPRTAVVHGGEQIGSPVTIHLSGDLASLIDARIAGQGARLIDRRLGRRSRTLTVAPGR